MKKFLLLFLIIELFLLVVFLSSSSLANAADEVVELKNPLGFLGIKTPGELVVRAFAGFASLMAAVAIAFTVFSGFKLIIASNEEAINSAKESLKWALGGFIVAISSFTLISATAKFLGFTLSNIGIGEDRIRNPINIGGELKSGSFLDVMNYVMINFLGLIGFATTLMIIYYGYRYITSAGNEEAIEKAKSGLKWSILGLIVTLLAYTIIYSIQKYLVLSPP